MTTYLPRFYTILTQIALGFLHIFIFGSIFIFLAEAFHSFLPAYLDARYGANWLGYHLGSFIGIWWGVALGGRIWRMRGANISVAIFCVIAWLALFIVGLDIAQVYPVGVVVALYPFGAPIVATLLWHTKLP